MSGCPFLTRMYRLYNSHVEEIHLCQACESYCTNRQSHQCQGQTGGAESAQLIDTSIFREYQRAHRGALRSYIHELQSSENDVSTVFTNLNPAMVTLLTELLQHFGNLKVIIKIVCIMARQVFDSQGEEDLVEQIAYFSNSVPKALYSSNEIPDVLFSIADEVVEKIAEFISKGSGYSVRKILSVEVRAMDFQLFRDLRGNGYIKMPLKRRGFVSFRTDNCFKYCIAAGLNWDLMEGKLTPKQLRHHVTWEQFFDLYDFTDVERDVSPFDDIPKFELKNNISCNVYGNKGERVLLIRESPYKFRNYVNLFLIQDQESSGIPDPRRTHYALIRDSLNSFAGEDIKKDMHVPTVRNFSAVKRN